MRHSCVCPVSLLPDPVYKSVIDTYHQIHVYRKERIYNPPEFTDGEVQIGEGMRCTAPWLRGGKAGSGPRLVGGWEPPIPLSTTPRGKEGAPSHLPSAPSSPATPHFACQHPAAVPNSPLLFLDLSPLCHKPCPSSVGFSWPPNYLLEPPAAKLSSWLSVYHTRTTP